MGTILSWYSHKSRLLFSVLLDPLVTTSPNEFVVLAAVTEYEEEETIDKDGESEGAPFQAYLWTHHCIWGGGFAFVFILKNQDEK